LTAKIEQIKILPVTWALKNEFKTTLGQKKFTRNLIVFLKTSNGLSGCGEASSSLALPEATQRSMNRVLEKAGRTISGRSILDWKEICLSLRKKFPQYPTAISAVECALLDLYCQHKRMPLFKFFGRKNKKIETYFTIPALNAGLCRSIIVRMSAQGFKRFKVKVTGQNSKEDFERVRLTCALAEGCSVIVDANCGWTEGPALKFIEKLTSNDLPVVLLEQPLFKDNIEGFRYLKSRSPIPIAVDESFRTLKEVKKIVEQNAADVFNIKIAKSGLWESLKIVRYLKKMKKRLMIGCMMESLVGLSASLHWAYGSGDFDFVDLDSFLLLKKLSIQSGFINKGASIYIRPGIVGSGISLNEKQLGFGMGNYS